MGLMELDRSELEAKADKYKVTYSKKMTDKDLRKLVRVAIKERKAAKAKAAEASTTDSKTEWPKEWPEEKRAEYYQTIVGQQMPKNERKAYSHLLKVIDERTPTEKIPSAYHGKEPDCYGLYYMAELETCTKVCPQMPLCKSICEARPELVQLVENSSAVQAVEKLSDAEKKELTEAHVQKSAKKAKAEKPKKGKPEEKPSKEPTRYVFVGDVTAYKTALDRENYRVYKWMKEQKSFTMKELVARYDAENLEDAASLAKQTIEYLIGEGDLRKKKSKA